MGVKEREALSWRGQHSQEPGWRLLGEEAAALAAFFPDDFFSVLFLHETRLNPSEQRWPAIRCFTTLPVPATA